MAMTFSRIIVVRFFVRVRVIRYHAEVIQVGSDSFQHADDPRPVESNKLRIDICIGPKIDDHAFTTLQSLQPLSAESQHLNFSRQAGSDLRFRPRPVRFFLLNGTSARLLQLAQPDWNLFDFGRVQKLVDSTRAQSGRASDFADRQAA
jgi:hypothetical protein